MCRFGEPPPHPGRDRAPTSFDSSPLTCGFPQAPPGNNARCRGLTLGSIGPRTVGWLLPPQHRFTGPHRADRYLDRLGVGAQRIYVDHGLTRTNRDGPGLREALAAVHEADMLVVSKLDRLVGTMPDARAIADELTDRKVRLNMSEFAPQPLGHGRQK
ncbi:recombinase family protein [Nocardia sp. NPDC055049]